MNESSASDVTPIRVSTCVTASRQLIRETFESFLRSLNSQCGDSGDSCAADAVFLAPQTCGELLGIL